MSRTLIFRHDARREFDEAADWYEAQRAGLGTRFLLAVQDVLDRILGDPEFYPKVWQEVREAIVTGFPYCVYYRSSPHLVVVVAVFHTSRNPYAWQSRG